MSGPDREDDRRDEASVESPAKEPAAAPAPRSAGAEEPLASTPDVSPALAPDAPPALAPDAPPALAPGASPAPAPDAPPALAPGAPPALAPDAPSAPPPSVQPAPRARPSRLAAALAERPEVAIEVPKSGLAARSRRDFLVYAAGLVASAALGWWLLPDRTKARLLPGRAHDRLDTLAARVGLSRARRERLLNRTLTFDDDVAEALYSRKRRVRTYDRSEAQPLRNNYNGQTPGPGYLATWSLRVSGLASGREERLTLEQLTRGFAVHEQVTRLVCVEGWSCVAWWGGIRFADLLQAFPPESGARWAAMRSAVNLDGTGRPDPYYVSIDLETARHPQTLLATHHEGRPLTVAHGAPLRLLAPMKLGLKNIKAITDIAYSASEPPDYWNERGYSKYDGL